MRNDICFGRMCVYIHMPALDLAINVLPNDVMACLLVSVFLIIALMIMLTFTYEIDYQGLLVNDLFRRYDSVYGSKLMPWNQKQKQLTVYFGLDLLRIDVDQDESTATIHGAYRYVWTDHRLSWIPSQYSNITEVRVPPEMVWKPDIAPYDTITNKVQPTNVVIYSGGTMLWTPPVEIFSHCTRAERQNNYICLLEYGSLTYTGDILTLDFFEARQDIDISNYTPSEKSEILTTSGKTDTIYYPCCSKAFPAITYNITMRVLSSV